MFDTVGIVVSVVLAGAFGFLAYRTWDSDHPGIRRAGTFLAVVITLFFVAVVALGLTGFAKLSTQYDNPIMEVTVAGTPGQIERGRKLVQICVGCHSPDTELPLIGLNFFEAGGPPIGNLYAPNLTPIHIASWSDGELIRAIREGVHKSGRSLLIMPSENFRYLSDDDVQAIVAYLRSEPATEPDTPPTRLNIIGAILANVIPFQTRQEPVGSVPAVPAGVTPEYGQYLVRITGCTSCHGPNLEGIAANDANVAPGPNLTKVVPDWSEADFIHFFRTGEAPDGYMVSEVMPWPDVDRFADDDDLKAMYAYLHALQPIDGPAD